MEMHAQLAFGGQLFQRFALPNRGVAFDIVADLRRKHEKSGIDPAAIAHRLFLETQHAIAVGAQAAEASRRLRRGQRRQHALALVQCDDLLDVHIAHAIAIGQAKGFVVFDIGQDALDAAADLGFVAGVH